MERRGLSLLILVLFMLTSSGIVLAFESTASREKNESFEKLVGGLGAGPALDLSDDFGFDPRLGGTESAEILAAGDRAGFRDRQRSMRGDSNAASP
jgi:hypothetical protein